MDNCTIQKENELVVAIWLNKCSILLTLQEYGKRLLLKSNVLKTVAFGNKSNLMSSLGKWCVYFIFCYNITHYLFIKLVCYTVQITRLIVSLTAFQHQISSNSFTTSSTASFKGRLPFKIYIYHLQEFCSN